MDLAYLWLQSGRPASIHGIALLPRAHPKFKNIVLREEKGQGSAYYLIEEKKSYQWILKRFRPAMTPDREYLQNIGRLVPKGRPFIAATERMVLTCLDAGKGKRIFYTTQFAEWLEGTILMPRVPGQDWGIIGDDLRNGNLTLSIEDRLKLALDLSRTVQKLEEAGCSHRDLSLGNVFFDLRNMEIYLIDFDTLFHQNLSFPKNTTPGTTGYMASWIHQNGEWCSKFSWGPESDRYALSVLISEFLLVDKGSPAFYDGSLFSQDILANPAHPHMKSSLKQLQKNFPAVERLFLGALKSRSFLECPSPYDWEMALTGNSICVVRKKRWHKVAGVLILLVLVVILFIQFLKYKPNYIWFWEDTEMSNNKMHEPGKNDNTDTYKTATQKPNLYTLKILYIDSDLILSIDNKVYPLRKDNTITELALTEGEHEVSLTFTGILSKNDGSVSRSNPISISKKIYFGEKNYMVFMINRKDMKWTQIE